VVDVGGLRRRRNGSPRRRWSFEIAVFEWMVLDCHGEAPVAWIERGPLGHSPRLERPTMLQAKIEMQVAGSVLLVHETQSFGRKHSCLTGRLVGLGEVALAPVLRKVTLPILSARPARQALR
jgi:hypothetical protein